MTRLSSLLALGLMLCGAHAAVTFEELLGQMTDLNRLARLPQPAYTEHQTSSYDRESVSPDQPGWFANDDRGRYLRVEQTPRGREYVMMEADGPGALLRIWSANPNGELRIYLDGATEPTYAEPMSDLLYGSDPRFPTPFAHYVAKGYTLYFPVPYARSCKVTASERRLYYHVNYRTYAPGTEVETLTPETLAGAKGRIGQLGDALRQPRTAFQPADGTPLEFATTVEPGIDAVLGMLEGPAAVTSLQMKVSAAAGEAPALRGLVLLFTFDGQTTVQCPVGDFFGTAPGLNRYESLPLGVAPETELPLWSHWVMPFRKRAMLRVMNLTMQPIEVSGTAQIAPWEWDDQSLLFCAKWRTERNVPSRPLRDWTILNTTGAGRFVGLALQVINRSRLWWGEGDEKIYVDGERFPSTFGTGTEDYFGYAWCDTATFEHAHHAQPRADGPGNYGNTENLRFQILDDVPFERSLKFDLELWHQDEHTTTDHSATAYWYARPGVRDDFWPLTAPDAKLVEIPAMR